MLPAKLHAIHQGLDGPGVRTQGGGDKRVSLLHNGPDRSWCPFSLLSDRYRDWLPWIKRPERGAYHPPQSSAVVKNE